MTSARGSSVGWAWVVAIGDQHWETLAIRSTFGQHNAQYAAATVDDHQRVERVVSFMYINVVTTVTDVVGTWLDRGVLTLIQWTDAVPGPPPDPGDLGDAFLSDLDIMDTAFNRLGPNNIFTNFWPVPADRVPSALDTRVRRRPPPGGQGTVWFTWGLPNFTGAGVEVGFDKIIIRTLITEVA